MTLDFLLGFIATASGGWLGVWTASKFSDSEEVAQLREQLDACLEDYRKAQARYKSTLGNLQKLQREKLSDNLAPPKGE